MYFKLSKSELEKHNSFPVSTFCFTFYFNGFKTAYCEVTVVQTGDVIGGE